MKCNFFIGDAFMVHKSPLSQTSFSFVGAKNLQDLKKWKVSVLATMANGYAGGGSTIVWEIELDEEIRVSSKIKGYFLTDGLNKQKIKEYPIKAIIFRQIEKDMIVIDFVE